MPTMLEMVTERVSALMLGGQSPCRILFTMVGYQSAREQDRASSTYLFNSEAMCGPVSTYNGVPYTVGGPPLRDTYDWQVPFVVVTEEALAEQHKVKLPPVEERATWMLEDILIDLAENNHVVEKGKPWRTQLPNMNAYKIEQGIVIDGARYIITVTAIKEN